MFKSFESYESFIKYELGSGSFHSVVPLPFFNSVKVRLWIYCVRFCQKVLFTNVGFCSSSGTSFSSGSFRTSPITSLYVEADEPLLYLRREKLSLQYAIKLAANPSNLAFRVTFSPQFSALYELKPHAIKPFGLRVSPLLESSNINPNNIEHHLITNIPPWCLKKPNIIFDLNTNRKSISSPHVLKQNFQVLQSRYAEY